MIVLGVDYGRRRIGLALASEGIIETKGAIEYRKLSQALEEIQGLIIREKVELVVVGRSSGAMGLEIDEFVRRLKKMIKLPVELVDETLTSWEAERRVGWRDKSRVNSVAAALILERYLDRIQSS